MRAGTSGTGIPYALAGWLSCFAVMGVCMAVFPLGTALIVHASAAPILFTILSIRYFRKHPSSDPLKTACLFTGIVVVMDFFIVALIVNRSLAMFASLIGTWLPFALIFVSVWSTGSIVRRKENH